MSGEAAAARVLANQLRDVVAQLDEIADCTDVPGGIAQRVLDRASGMVRALSIACRDASDLRTSMGVRAEFERSMRGERA